MPGPGSTPISQDFIKPCLPCVTLLPPSGEEWLHEIKHFGHRLIVRRDGDGTRLFTERGEDWTGFFPRVVEAVGHIPARSCIMDGELVRCDDQGKPTTGPLREGASEKGAAFYAFDLIEVNGFDLRRDPIEDRKRVLAHLLRRPPDGIRLNPQFEKGGGEGLLRQVSRLGFEGVLSRRRGSRYLSGRCPDWLLSRKLE
jgi:bifunctional non-homologous end joining protein LigD